MTTETMIAIDHKSVTFNLRFAKKDLREKPVDIGYACMVGDKAIRIYPNNLVEIADIEYIRSETIDDPEAGYHTVSYTERLSWTTEYPQDVERDRIKASLDFAFMSAGLPSLFYITNLSLVRFDSIDECRIASIKAFHILYPGINPCLTELNGTLYVYGRDLFELNRLDEDAAPQLDS